MATLLMPLPDSDFDPTESGVPWCTMRDHGHNVVFATPTARTALADPKMVTGEGLGILSPLLKADANGRSAGAICHGVLLAARSSLHSGKSVLYGKKTTALTKQMELIAWRLIPRGFLAGNRRHQPSLTS